MVMRRIQTVLFDGDCSLCQASVRVIRSLDLLRQVRFMDIANEWPAVQKQFPQLRQEICLEEMHLVRADGRVVTGFDAYRTLAWVLPVGWLVLPFLYLPGVRFLGRRIYASIAGGRQRPHCPLPPDDGEGITRQ